MMTDEQKSKVAELRSAIAAATRADGVPREARVAAVSLKRELRRTGTTARELAGVLGVHESTLCRWEREVGSGTVAAADAKRRARVASKRGARAPRFRRVEVTPTAAMSTSSRSAVTSVQPAGRCLRVAHAPSGLVVDGLDVETLAALLRRMS
jgi:hypothetical protein